MQEIAQGYVLIVISLKFSVLTSFKDFPFVRSPFYLQALVLIYSDKIVKISMKLCPVSIRVSWKKKLDNGGRFTRFVSTFILSVNIFDSFFDLQQALQLLEYLIKHGSERVVDDARSHISTLKMLRNFHYIDDKGKDEGLNGNPHCLYH